MSIRIRTIKFYPNGKVKREELYYRNKLQSVDGEPAVVEYDDNGNKIVEEWYHLGELTRRVDEDYQEFLKMAKTCGLK